MNATAPAKGERERLIYGIASICGGFFVVALAVLILARGHYGLREISAAAVFCPYGVLLIVGGNSILHYRRATAKIPTNAAVPRLRQLADAAAVSVALVGLYYLANAYGLEAVAAKVALTPGGLSWSNAYRLLTYSYLHASPFHLANNLIAIWIWWLLDRDYGRDSKWIFFVGGIIAGGLASNAGAPQLSVGASAGVTGLMGAGLFRCFDRRDELYWRLLVLTMAFGNQFPLLYAQNADHLAHFTGLFFGLVAASAEAACKRSRWVQRYRIVHTAGIVAQTIWLAGLAFMVRCVLIS